MSRPVRINIDIKLTDKDYHNLISGLKPDDMGEKWFAKLPKFDDIIRAIIKLCDKYELARN